MLDLIVKRLLPSAFVAFGVSACEADTTSLSFPQEDARIVMDASVPVDASYSLDVITAKDVPLPDAIIMADAGSVQDSGEHPVPDSSVDPPVITSYNHCQIPFEWFNNFEGPFCERFYDQTLPSILFNHNNEIMLSLKHFPLDYHLRSQKAAEAYECRIDPIQPGNIGLPFDYIDLLFTSSRALEDDDLIGYAQMLNLDVDAFRSCLLNDDKFQIVRDQFNEGLQRGVQGTPAFFVNGQHISGAQPYSVFQQIIETEYEAACHKGCNELLEYANCFVTDERFNGYLVVGGNAPATDNLSMVELAVNMRYEDGQGNLFPVIVEDAARLDSEIVDITAQNLIVIGNPCNNTVAAELLGNPTDCNSFFSPGQSRVMLFVHQTGYSSMLVAGYNGEDTRVAADVMAHRWNDFEEGTTDVSITGTTHLDAIITRLR